MPELDPMKRRLPWTVYATPLMTLTTDLGLSVRVSMFEQWEGLVFRIADRKATWRRPGGKRLRVFEHSVTSRSLK